MGAGENEPGVVLRRPMSSTYGTSYLPTMEGTRTRVWKEGFDQRLSRKQNGFRHVAIEWDVLTDRNIGMKQFCDDDIKVEELFLPTSRIERKRRQLMKEYDRAKKREERKKTELRKKLSVDDAGIIRHHNINEYEKNKARNHATNIQFPTPVSTARSHRSSRGGSRSLSSAKPARSKSAYHRKRSPEKQLTESISKLSVSDVKSRPLGLSQDQVDTLQHAAHGGADQGHDNVSAMDKYLQMKTQQEMDSIQCSH